MLNQGLFTSKTDEWATPQSFFNELDQEFHFRLAPCCTVENRKCNIFYVKEDDGLSHEWYRYGPVFMNPPYGREIGKWVKRAYEESQKGLRWSVYSLPELIPGGGTSGP